ncbi:uncharacterized protein LOC128960082 [Oppia nitens]|uniref:uncharacterized protein LOC128960082 n=1 Tax=Oppia nitens TaxID=1686743 RepID=UPI0023DAD7FE|nr:uncharacterized protein LOC128960082 [Oppia nitens]
MIIKDADRHLYRIGLQLDRQSPTYKRNAIHNPWLIWLIGMVYSVYAPIMVDMKYILNTSMRWVSLFTTFETSGFILGTVVTFLYKYVSRQLVMSIFFTLLTIASAVIPLVPHLYVLYLCAFAIGISSSVFVCAVSMWIIELGRGGKVPIVQIFELSFGIGSILSTVALKPYLIGETSTSPTHTKSNQTFYDFNRNEELVIDEEVVIDRRSRLMKPTLIIGSCIIIIPISLLAMYVMRPYKEPKEKGSDDDNDNNNINERTGMSTATTDIKLFDRKETPRKTIRLLFALFYAMYLIYETVFMKFAVTYFQYSPLKLSAERSAEIYSVAISVYTAGLGLNILYPYKFQIKTIISFHYVFLIGGSVMLIPARNSLSFLWCSTILTCMGFSAMYSGILSIAEQYLDMTNRLSALFLLFRGILTLVTPFIVGNYIEDNSSIFIIMEFIYLGVSLVLFITIDIMIRRFRHLSTVDNNSNKHQVMRQLRSNSQPNDMRRLSVISH